MDSPDDNLNFDSNQRSKELGDVLDNDEDDSWRGKEDLFEGKSGPNLSKENAKFEPNSQLLSMARRNKTLELESGNKLNIEKSGGFRYNVESPENTQNNDFRELLDHQGAPLANLVISNEMNCTFDSQSINLKSPHRGNRKLYRKKSKTQFVENAQLVRNSEMNKSYNSHSSIPEERPPNEFD